MNRGAKRLRELFPDRGVQGQIAKACGVKQPTVSRWLSGDKLPNAHSRLKLRDLYGIGFALWDEVDPCPESAA